MKKILLFLFALWLNSMAFAYDIDHDGLYYNVINEIDDTHKEVEVTNRTGGYESDYSGDVVIPSSFIKEDVEYTVTAIGNCTFYQCMSLTSVTIPEGVTSIGNNAFLECSSLTAVTIPNSVTSIGEDAFLFCSGLTSMGIPNNVTSIGKGAFQYCSGLTSITIPNSVTYIGYRAFSDCSGLTSIQVDAENPVYDSRDNCNAIIHTESGALIAGCAKTVIPSGVTSIGGKAFSGCSGLTSVTIPNSVTSIGESAFSGCSGLTSIIIPNSVTSIGNCTFQYCMGITSVTIPNSVTNIGYNAFWVCTSLTSVNIPNSVTSIGSCAFYQCMSLTSVTIPNSVTSIGDQAFRDCSSLTSVIIPNSVKNVGGYAFSGTPWYENMEDGMVYIGRTAYDYKGEMPAETAIVIKEGTTAIAGGAFQDCSGLTSITIPNSVTYIGDVAFRYCSGLTSITIPNNVTYIGYNAFGYCGNLTSVVSEIENLSAIGYYLPSQDGLPSTCQLTVPYGTKEAYAARGWTEEVFQGGVVEAPYNPGTDNYLEISYAEVLKGRSVSIPVSMRNSEPITAMQLEVALPENVTLAECRLTDRAGTDHAASFRQKSNGNYQITVFSMSNENMKGSEGAVLELVVETSEESAADHHAIILKNIELTTEDVVAIRPYDVYATLIVSDMKVADANGDGKISITDAVAIAGYLLENPPRSFVQLAADVNGDGSITITDAVAVIDMILNDEASAKARKTAADMLDPQ